MKGELKSASSTGVPPARLHLRRRKARCSSECPSRKWPKRSAPRHSTDRHSPDLLSAKSPSFCKLLARYCRATRTLSDQYNRGVYPLRHRTKTTNENSNDQTTSAIAFRSKCLKLSASRARSCTVAGRGKARLHSMANPSRQ